MSKRQWLAVAVAGLALALVCGCAKKAAEEQAALQGAAKKPTKGKVYRFALVPKMFSNPVFQIAHSGALKFAEEHPDVEVIFQAPEEADIAKQVAIIDNLIQARVDGISVSCNEPTALTEAINRAVDAGIPTMCFDSDAPESKRFTYWGTANRKSGRRLAKLMIEALGGGQPSGKVAIITGVPGAPNLEERIEGVKEELSKYPGIELLNPIPCYDKIDEGVRVVKDTIRAYPDLVGIIMVGGWPLFAECPGPFEGLEPGKIKCVSFDAIEPEQEYVRRGYVYALLAQSCYDWGYQSMKLLYEKVVEGKEVKEFYEDPLPTITKDNVEEWAKKWASWLPQGL